MRKIKRTLKEYRDIRETNFKSYGKTEREWLMSDLCRDYAFIHVKGSIAEAAAFKREFTEYFKALKQQDRIIHWTNYFNRLSKGFFYGPQAGRTNINL